MSNVREMILERRRSSTTSSSSDGEVKSIQRTRIWKSKDHINVPEHILKEHQMASSELIAGDLEDIEGATGSSSEQKVVMAEIHAADAERKRRATVQPKVKEPVVSARPQRQSLPAQFVSKSMSKAELDAMLADDMLMRQELEKLGLGTDQHQPGQVMEEDTADSHDNDVPTTDGTADSVVEQLIDLGSAAGVSKTS